jgi:hypothetical protein
VYGTEFFVGTPGKMASWKKWFLGKWVCVTEFSSVHEMGRCTIPELLNFLEFRTDTYRYSIALC